jgi:hypothetical protein
MVVEEPEKLIGGFVSGVPLFQTEVVNASGLN